MKDEPTMLLKTKENESDILDDPTMSMKTNGLIFGGHDVYENKCSYHQNPFTILPAVADGTV